MKNLEYLINVTLQRRFGTRNINKVLKESPTVDVFKMKVANIFKIANNQIEDNFLKIQKLLTKADLSGIKLISYYDEEYPQLLREIADSPLILACKGNVKLLKSNTMSVVGTREPSSYGISITKELCNYLSTENITTVSGMAFGIDALVHLNSTQTIAVLPTFPDKSIPVKNKEVYSNILSNNGLIISDNLFEDSVQNYMYVSRNRIIAGLSKKTVITEAGENSGALITAQYAFDYDREVYAVPGNIYAKESLGCNQLIETNLAKILSKFEDLV